MWIGLDYIGQELIDNEMYCRSQVSAINLFGYLIAFLGVCWYNYKKLQAVSFYSDFSPAFASLIPPPSKLTIRCTYLHCFVLVYCRWSNQFLHRHQSRELLRKRFLWSTLTRPLIKQKMLIRGGIMFFGKIKEIKEKWLLLCEKYDT